MTSKNLIFCAALASLACSGAALATGAPGAAAPKVCAEKVSETKNVIRHRYTGRIVSPARVDLVARVSGELLEVGFEEGSIVEAGHVMYTLDAVPYEAAVQSAEAAVAECQAKQEYAQRTYDRVEDLFKKQVTSKDSYDSAVSDLAYAKAALKGAEAALIKAKDNLDDTKIISPITGKAGITSLTRGNYVTPSSGILASVVQYDPLRVRFSISNKDFLESFGSEEVLKQKAKVELKLSDGKVYGEMGKIIIVDNEANVGTDTIVLYALFSNKENKLVPNSTVVATLQYEEPGMTPCITPSGIMHDAASAYVYVIGEGNVAFRRNIIEGAQYGGRQLVLSGLQPGETVVTDGMLKVVIGSPVEPVFQGK